MQACTLTHSCKALEHYETCPGRTVRLQAEVRQRRRILDIEAHEYHGVWRLWKVVSLCLFGLFVAVLWDISRTLRALSEQRR